MLRRKQGPRPPTIDALTVDTFGWPALERSEALLSWKGEADILTINFFPIVPDVSRPPGDDDALVDQMRGLGAGGDLALVEAGWQATSTGVPVARVIVKLPQQPSGMTYLGSLIVPFAMCSWVVKLQCFEAGPTGMREALWLNDHLAGGGSLADAGIDTSPPPRGPDDPRPPVTRAPADDPRWDDRVPDHPLSRLRRRLPALVASVRLAPEAQGLAPFV